MHSGSLESTQEARVALGYRLVQILRIFRALQTSRVHPQLDIRTLRMNKFLINKVFPFLIATTQYSSAHALPLFHCLTWQQIEHIGGGGGKIDISLTREL